MDNNERSIEFINKARKIHGDKYDYFKVEYVGSKSPVCIICPTHGEFYQKPNDHLSGKGCKQCGTNSSKKKRAKTTEQFVEDAKKVHGNEYDYSKVNYIDSKTEVCIICNKHGEFYQKPNYHLNGCGCNKCYGTHKLTTEEFIKRSIEVHGSKYTYDKTKYINSSTNVTITCPIHGDFEQNPYNHMHGTNCPKCVHQSYKHTLESFAEAANKIHHSKYDYSKVNYVNNNTPIDIICNKHGLFKQIPNNHLDGCGCPKCNSSKLETDVERVLDENNIPYEREKKFPWLGNLRLDFYLPSKNIAIECQGIQHFEPRLLFGWLSEFESTKKRDDLKRKLCEENNVDLIYYTKYSKNKEIADIYRDIDELLEIIKNRKDVS